MRPVDSPIRSLFVLIPLFNDWQAVEMLLPMVDAELRGIGEPVHVLLVDDGSTTPMPEPFLNLAPVSFDSVQVLALRRNVGHQRAIAIGLSHIEAKHGCRAVVVMDGDGEDAPSDVPRLLAKMDAVGGRHIIFAERARRSESALFRTFYQLYRLIHVALTGISVRMGNFSVIPRCALTRLVVVSDLWNHYAASVHKANIAFDTVRCERAARLRGTPKMNFGALVGHGLSAMSVFGDRIGVRMMIASSSLVVLSLGLATALWTAHGVADLTLPGWNAYAMGILIVILLQALLFSIVFAFIILASRNMSGFIPTRDHVHFIAECRTVYSAHE